MSIEKRIEKLEEQSSSSELPEKLVSLFLRLRGFREKYGLGPNPSREEVEAAVCGRRELKGEKKVNKERITPF